MIKAIIFDFGKVFFKIDWKRIQKDFLFYHGIKLKLNKNFQKIHEDAQLGNDSFEKFLSNINPSASPEETIKFYKSSYLKARIINQKLLEVAKKLKSKYKLYGFTDTNRIHYEANQEAGMFSSFREVFTSFSLRKRKTEPEVFSEVMKSIKLRPEQCLFIDNNPINVKNAKNIGMEVIQYSDFPKTENLLSEMRDKGIVI